MLYTSTRNKAVHVSSAQAIAQGISAEGGLFVPEEIPKLSMVADCRACVSLTILSGQRQYYPLLNGFYAGRAG